MMRVLAKAYKGRPLEREATGRGDRVIYLADTSIERDKIEANDGVGFPKESVFRFDVELFRQLDSAWSAHDHNELADLWSHAIPVGENFDV